MVLMVCYVPNVISGATSVLVRSWLTLKQSLWEVHDSNSVRAIVMAVSGDVMSLTEVDGQVEQN